MMLAFAALLGFGAYQLAAEGGGGSGTDSPTPVEPPAVPPDPDDPAIEQMEDAVEEDNARPRFEGQLGDFLIVGDAAFSNFPCPEGSSLGTAEDYQSSELGFTEAQLDDPELAGPRVSVCAGQVRLVAGDLVSLTSPQSAFVVHGYFTGDLLELPLEAPKERLELREIAGDPGLLELPPQDLIPNCRVFVIERPATDGEAGVYLEVTANLSCEEAIALAEELLNQSRISS